eukprot:2555621-Lingulodinium_polyedra.AAC.1
MTALLKHLPGFVAEKLAFRPPPLAQREEDVRPFWSAVGVEAHKLALFTSLDPLYSNGRLWVNYSPELASNPLTQITD